MNEVFFGRVLVGASMTDRYYLKYLLQYQWDYLLSMGLLRFLLTGD